MNGILTKRGKNFVYEDIPEVIRNDYEQFLMGQLKFEEIRKNRNTTIHKLNRMFNFLFHEKRYSHQKQEAA